MKEVILNAAIGHLKKSPVLQAAVSVVDAWMDRINDTFQCESIPLNKIVENFSDSVDGIICHYRDSESLVFLGGELSAFIKEGDQNSFFLLLQLYFNNSNGSYVLKESLKEMSRNILTNESLDELLQKSTIKFEVTPPETGR